MDEKTLIAHNKETLRLKRAEDAQKLFKEFRESLGIKRIATLASNNYLNIPRSYIYDMLKGKRPVGDKTKERMQKLLDTI